MDIKDFILIGGGLLIAAVVAHGFWIAWRARRDPLRMDLVTDLPEGDDEDDLRRLRAELPNGGARIVGTAETPAQGALPLDRHGGDAGAGEPLPQAAAEPAGAGGEPAQTSPPLRARPAPQGRKTEPRLDPAPVDRPRAAARQSAAGRPPAAERTPLPERPSGRQRPATGRGDKVADVILPERSARTDEPKEPRRWPARKPAPESRPEQRPSARSRGAGLPGGAERKGEPPVQELIVVNVLAPKGKPFVGGGLVEALRGRGLRYGDMNIFHRVDPISRASLYSVANVVEPGTFDVSDLDSFRSPGVCFFMQLPGPEQPLEAFEDMLKAAREVAVRVGGELKDEQRSVMTGQTVEHYRQRISEFCRRRMSMRA